MISFFASNEYHLPSKYILKLCFLEGLYSSSLSSMTNFSESFLIKSSADKLFISLTTRLKSKIFNFAIETGKSIEELERYVGQFLTLQENIISYTRHNTEETEQAFQVFVDSIPETEKSVVSLKESSRNVEKVSNSMESLQNAVAHFNTSSHSFQTFSASTPIIEQSSMPMPELGTEFEMEHVSKF